MLQAERHKIICTHVQQQGSALVTELSVLCQVSQETIRRDLTVLQKKQKLIRSFGGAVALDSPEIPVIDIKEIHDGLNVIDRAESFRKRTEEHPDTKMKIAKAALQFIRPGDCILLDNSSSCWFLARQIPDIEITVVTNSVKIIQALAAVTNCASLGLAVNTQLVTMTSTAPWQKMPSGISRLIPFSSPVRGLTKTVALEMAMILMPN